MKGIRWHPMASHAAAQPLASFFGGFPAKLKSQNDRVPIPSSITTRSNFYAACGGNLSQTCPKHVPLFWRFREKTSGAEKKGESQLQVATVWFPPPMVHPTTFPFCHGCFHPASSDPIRPHPEQQVGAQKRVRAKASNVMEQKTTCSIH